jgi:hypothetical protein
MTPHSLLPLALTNKAMHDLALEVYYGYNTILVSRNVDWPRWKYPEASRWMYTKASIAHRVRKLEVRIEVPCGYSFTPSSMLNNSTGDWKFLFKLNDPQKHNDGSWRWQSAFRSLQHLKLLLIIPRNAVFCQAMFNHPDTNREILLAGYRKMLKLATIELHAQTVEVVVDGGWTCQGFWSMNTNLQAYDSDIPCGGACREMTQQVIREKAEEGSSHVGQRKQSGEISDASVTIVIRPAFTFTPKLHSTSVPKPLLHFIPSH